MAAHYRSRFASPREHTNWTIKQSACALFFFSEHDPFPAYLKRFHLSDSDQCSCGGTGTELHYVTECALTGSWHMRMPTPNFEQEWLKRAANNLVSRQLRELPIWLYRPEYGTSSGDRLQHITHPLDLSQYSEYH
ncbi:hypothetical protein AVEN_142056-1 [Araneus ventricosus]|uniref:Uncharacterized protein n=1 Tax=Araneus ventricosus TaxID=182803 RepID=A0A4Y2S976_ARAVE|nr:hypothetical protein AVEN_142056-1 [Araneus ventricosus]